MVTQPNFVWPRYRVLDLSPQIFERLVGFAVRLPVPVNTYHTLYRPFDGRTWVFVAVATVSVVLVLWAINRFHPGIERRPSSSPLYHLMSAASVSLVGESVPARWFFIRSAAPGFLLMFVWLPLALVLNSAYESILLSHLVSVSREEPVDTFQEMLALRLPFHLLGGTALDLVMARHPRRVVREVHRLNVLRLGGHFDVAPPDALTRKVLEGRVAMLATSDTILRYSPTRLIGNGRHGSWQIRPSFPDLSRLLEMDCIGEKWRG